MFRMLLTTLTAIVLYSTFLSVSHAQTTIDYTTLIKKTDASHFEVQGAVKVDNEEALELNKMGVTFIDVRRTIQYDLGHIAGAVGLELKTQLTEESLSQHVAKDQKVVFYCSDAKCYRSAHASAKAITWGYTDVIYYANGWSTWLAKGYPKE